MTYKERLVAGLLAIGYSIDQNDKSRYVALCKVNSERKVFVGNAGALRTGRCASQSHSVGDPSRQTAFYILVLEKGTPPESFATLAKEFEV